MSPGPEPTFDAEPEEWTCPVCGGHQHPTVAPVPLPAASRDAPASPPEATSADATAPDGGCGGSGYLTTYRYDADAGGTVPEGEPCPGCPDCSGPEGGR